MPEVEAYWRAPQFHSEEQAVTNDPVRTGVLTTEHEAADDETPVLVEEISARVYRPEDLPPDTTIFVEGPPGKLPPIARLADRAGFVVKHAEDDPQRP